MSEGHGDVGLDSFGDSEPLLSCRHNAVKQSSNFFAESSLGGRRGRLAALARAHEGLPLGPSSTEELFAWPQALADNLAASEGEKGQLLKVLRGGVLLYSHYSGVDCPGEALDIGFAAIAQRWGWQCLHSPFRTASSCDISVDCRRILLSQGDQRCVFRDIEDRLPLVARRWLDSCVEYAHDEKDANAQMEKYLLDNKSWCFDGKLTAPCDAHHQHCPVVPSHVPATDLTPPKQRRRINVEGVKELDEGSTSSGWAQVFFLRGRATG